MIENPFHPNQESYFPTTFYLNPQTPDQEQHRVALPLGLGIQFTDNSNTETISRSLHFNSDRPPMKEDTDRRQK